MNKIIHYIGLDVHKDSIAVSIAPQNSTEVRRYGIIGGTLDAVGHGPGKLSSCHPLGAWHAAESQELRECQRRSPATPSATQSAATLSAKEVPSLGWQTHRAFGRGCVQPRNAKNAGGSFKILKAIALPTSQVFHSRVLCIPL